MNEEYVLEESTKALVDALAQGGIFPEELSRSISLLGQIEALKSQTVDLDGQLAESGKELARYKSAYSKVKVEKDHLASSKLELENRISDLTSKANRTAKLVADLQQRDTQIAQLQQKLATRATRTVSLESLYQEIKALLESRTDLFGSNCPKVIEVRVTTEAQSPHSIYFSYSRVNQQEPPKVLQLLVV